MTVTMTRVPAMQACPWQTFGPTVMYSPQSNGQLPLSRTGMTSLRRSGCQYVVPNIIHHAQPPWSHPPRPSPAGPPGPARTRTRMSEPSAATV